jgi:UDP-N-acetylmuramyl pentapeptide synthase
VAELAAHALQATVDLAQDRDHCLGAAQVHVAGLAVLGPPPVGALVGGDVVELCGDGEVGERLASERVGEVADRAVAVTRTGRAVNRSVGLSLP